MPVIVPLPWSECLGAWPLTEATWQLVRAEEMTRDAGGALHVRELAEPRWRVAVTLDVLPLGLASEAMAVLEWHGSSRPILVHDPAHPGPRSDPRGLTLGAAAPVVHTLASPAIRIGGLPPGYALGRGDRVSIGGRLHALMEAGVASAEGVTPLLTLSPPPRTGAAVGQAVELVGVAVPMRIEPRSVRPGRITKSVVTGIAFTALEAG